MNDRDLNVSEQCEAIAKGIEKAMKQRMRDPCNFLVNPLK